MHNRAWFLFIFCKKSGRQGPKNQRKRGKKVILEKVALNQKNQKKKIVAIGPLKNTEIIRS